MKLNKIILGLGVVAATTAVSQGAVIADWDFSSVTGLTPDGSAIGTLISSDKNAVLTSVTSSDLVGSGVVGQFELAYEDANGAPAELNLRNFSGPANFPEFNDNVGVIDFTLTAAAGMTLTIEDIVISAYRNGAGAAAIWQYQVNVDGAGFTNFGSAIAAVAGGAPGFQIQTFDGADIVGASSVVFRFSGINGSGNIHFNDIKVNGSVSPIPEPSSTALLGLGGLALILRRRK